MSASRDSAGDSKPSISGEAKKTYELAIARETEFLIKYDSGCLRVLPFSPTLVACYQTNTDFGPYLRIYEDGEVVFAFPRSYWPKLVFSPTAGELVAISSNEAHRWKNFESKKPVSEDMPEMKILSSECEGESTYIVEIPKPIYTAPDGSWYFFTGKKPGFRGHELKQFDGKEVISIAQLPRYWSDLIVWNQNGDIIELSGPYLYKVKSGMDKELKLEQCCRSITLLPDYMVAVHSIRGIEIVDTKHEMKSIGKKKLEKISTLLTNPDTGELIVVFNDGRINIFAVNKTPEGGVEFVETESIDSKLTGICTAEWNPYTHRVLVMSINGFKEIELVPVKKIREEIGTHLIDSLTEITMQYLNLGFFKPSKPTPPAEIDKPDHVSADWSDLNEGP